MTSRGPIRGESNFPSKSTHDDVDRFEWPDVTIVVPVYNDPEGIRTTLDALVYQTYPTDRYEVMVVDNGSTDETRAVVQEFVTDYDHVCLLEETTPGSYAARNRGIRAARGDIIAFVDADMSVESDWLHRAVTTLTARDAEYLACAVQIYPPEGEESLAGKFNRVTDLQVGRFVERMQFAPTCSLLVSRELFDAVGRFDPRFRSSGDLEFGQRVAETGRTLHYAPRVLMYHPARSTLRSVLKKSYRIGRGKVELHRYYPERYGHPIRRVANPLAYLPPSPAYLKATVEGWSDLSLREQVTFYMLSYAAKLTKAAGQLHEFLVGVAGCSVTGTRTSRDDP